MTGTSVSDDRPQSPPFPGVSWRNAIHGALEVPAVVKLLAIPHPDSALREIARVLDRGGIFVYETRLGQLLSHPLRSFGRGLCWSAEPSLVPVRAAALWATRVKR